MEPLTVFYIYLALGCLHFYLNLETYIKLTDIAMESALWNSKISREELEERVGPDKKGFSKFIAIIFIPVEVPLSLVLVFIRIMGKG
jgi:hypothetical protein